MKRLIRNGILATTLLLLSGGIATAQPINMGTNPVNFGTGCTYTYIHNPANNSLKLNFGYYSGCVGPIFSQDQIFMDLNNARIGVGVTTPSYQIHLSSNSAGKPGSSTWTIVSDKRLKQDVNQFSDGLATVRGISPVTFHYNEASGYDTKPEYVGILAQDLQKVAPYMVKEAELLDAEGKSTEYMTVDLGAMDFVLVNAIKELDSELQTQKAENEALRNLVAEVRAEMAALKASGTPAVNPALEIAPNPAGSSTTLRVTLPKGFQSAEIQVVGIDGQVQRVVPVQGSTSLTLDTATLPAGNYILKLMSDGKVVATNRMVKQ